MRSPILLRLLGLFISFTSVLSLFGQQQQTAMVFKGEMLPDFSASAMTYLVTDHWVGSFQAPADDAASQFLFCPTASCADKWARGNAVNFNAITTWFANGSDGLIDVEANKYYSFTIQDVATGINSSGVVIETDGAPQPVTTVSRTSTVVAPGQLQTITATVAGALPAGQGLYLRYSTDDFANSTVVAMTMATATTYTATIPGTTNVASANVDYYVFSSGSGLSINGGDADRFTINLNNNNDANYGYSVAADWATAQNGDWSTPATWAPGETPPAGADVRIEHTVDLDVNIAVSDLNIAMGGNLRAFSRTIDLSDGSIFSVTGTFTRGAGSTLTFAGAGSISGNPGLTNVAIGGGVNFGDSELFGTLTINSGGFVATNAPAYQSGATLRYNSGSSYTQSLEWPQSGGPDNVRISNGTQVLLQGFRALTKGSSVLDLESGRLVLNGNAFQNQGTVQRTASTTDNFIECGASATATGFYEQNLSNGDTKSFEVGVGNEYAPVSISRTTGTNTGLFAVRVFPGVLENGTSGAAVGEERVDLSWEITQTGATTLLATVDLQWNSSAESASFQRSTAVINSSSGGSAYAPVVGLQTRAGSDPYTQSVTGLTQFSVFAVLNSGVLPVEWLAFSGRARGTEVQLHWTTASERNSDYFGVQRKTGSQWVTVGRVAAAGYSAMPIDYTFTDPTPGPGRQYYRLAQYDFDGSRRFSPLVSVDMIPSGPSLRIHPNPTADRVWLSRAADRVECYDATGRLVKTFAGITPDTPLSLADLPAGLYRMLLWDGRGGLVATSDWIHRR